MPTFLWSSWIKKKNLIQATFAPLHLQATASINTSSFSCSQNCILYQTLLLYPWVSSKWDKSTTQVIPSLFLKWVFAGYVDLNNKDNELLLWRTKDSCVPELLFWPANFLDIWISFFDKYFETNCKKLWYCSFWLLDAAEFWFIASVPREILLFIQYLWDFYSCQMPKSIWQ